MTKKEKLQLNKLENLIKLHILFNYSTMCLLETLSEKDSKERVEREAGFRWCTMIHNDLRRSFSGFFEPYEIEDIKVDMKNIEGSVKRYTELSS